MSDKRILIVEDDAEVRALLEEQLSDLEDTEIASTQRRGSDYGSTLGALMALAGDTMYYPMGGGRKARKLFAPPPKPKEVTEYDRERILKAEQKRLKRCLKRLRDMKKG